MLRVTKSFLRRFLETKAYLNTLLERELGTAARDIDKTECVPTCSGHKAIGTSQTKDCEDTRHGIRYYDSPSYDIVLVATVVGRP